MPAFLAVLNMEPEKPETVARNLERVLTARLRDARFFWDADRGHPLEWHRERLSTVAFHKGLGTFLDKAERLEPLAALDRRRGARPARRGRRRGPRGPAVQGRSRHQHGARADRAAGHDRRALRPRGRRARSGVEGDLPPLPADRASKPMARRRGASWARRRCRGRPSPWPTSSTRWSGMFAAGERPTGSRDPYGIRRAAQGIVRILADLPELTGVDVAIESSAAGRARRGPASGSRAGRRRSRRCGAFLQDRVRSVFEQRGADVRNVRAVTHEPTPWRGRSSPGASSTCCPS